MHAHSSIFWYWGHLLRFHHSVDMWLSGELKSPDCLVRINSWGLLAFVRPANTIFFLSRHQVRGLCLNSTSFGTFYIFAYNMQALVIIVIILAIKN